jgi:hypothetical protein
LKTECEKYQKGQKMRKNIQTFYKTFFYPTFQNRSLELISKSYCTVSTGGMNCSPLVETLDHLCQLKSLASSQRKIWQHLWFEAKASAGLDELAPPAH